MSKPRLRSQSPASNRVLGLAEGQGSRELALGKAAGAVLVDEEPAALDHLLDSEPAAALVLDFVAHAERDAANRRRARSVPAKGVARGETAEPGSASRCARLCRARAPVRPRSRSAGRRRRTTSSYVILRMSCAPSFGWSFRSRFAILERRPARSLEDSAALLGVRGLNLRVAASRGTSGIRLQRRKSRRSKPPRGDFPTEGVGKYLTPGHRRVTRPASMLASMLGVTGTDRVGDLLPRRADSRILKRTADEATLGRSPGGLRTLRSRPCTSITAPFGSRPATSAGIGSARACSPTSSSPERTTSARSRG